MKLICQFSKPPFYYLFLCLLYLELFPFLELYPFFKRFTKNPNSPKSRNSHIQFSGFSSSVIPLPVNLNPFLDPKYKPKSLL